MRQVNMQYTVCSDFSEEERAINAQLNALFDQWSKELKQVWDSYDESYFVTDGLFPAYGRQHPKVLFVGRETLDIMGQSYIDIFLPAIREKWVGGKPLERHAFFKRMLKITYGLIHDCPDWKDIPPASVIADTFATHDGVSFAFMNLSKLSHEYADNPSWQADWGSINLFVEKTLKCSQNYFQREIEILEPDIIVTMNLESFLSAFGDIRLQESIPSVNIHVLSLQKRSIPVFDCWHFACFSKPDLEAFYLPICDACKHFRLQR